MDRKRIWLLALVIIAALLCCASTLAETSGTDGDIQWTLSNDGVLTISGNGYMKDYSADYFNGYNFTTTAPWGSWESDMIKSIIINQGVKNISNYAFYNCKNLTSITIPDSVRTIDEYAFHNCSNLKELIIPGSVKKIGWGAFEYCHNLQSIILQEGIRRIEPNAFSGCSKLSEMTIPESVSYVGERVFSGCSGLADENGCIVIGDTLYGCRPTNGRLNIPNGVKKNRWFCFLEL